MSECPVIVIDRESDVYGGELRSRLIRKRRLWKCETGEGDVEALRRGDVEYIGLFGLVVVGSKARAETGGRSAWG